ncbi:hypothetical protein LINGRAHAP2_LOCUS29151 [Linum grandiflorum]
MLGAARSWEFEGSGVGHLDGGISAAAAHVGRRRRMKPPGTSGRRLPLIHRAFVAEREEEGESSGDAGRRWTSSGRSWCKLNGDAGRSSSFARRWRCDSQRRCKVIRRSMKLGGVTGIWDGSPAARGWPEKTVDQNGSSQN